MRGQAVNKLRRRARWSREEIGLAIFGTVAIFISLATLALSLLIWQTRIGIAARELLALGPVGALILALIALVFVGPLAVALVARGVATVRTATRLAASRRARAAQRELGARIALLARVRFLAGLQRPALAALASHLKVESYGEGQIVFAEGSAGDRFYLVRSGRLRAIAPDGTEFGTIIPGEGFGELALLDRTVRSATVQAIAEARGARALVCFDVNYRAKLWSADEAKTALGSLLAGVDILISTADDARLLLSHGESAEQLAEQLALRFSAGTVVVTDAGRCAAAQNGQVVSKEGYEVESVDRVGAGDAFAAGFIHGYLTGGLDRALEYAVAVGALKHTYRGDVAWVSKEDLKEFLSGSPRWR